jgi:uncharacterized RDD family membrane protein YckC
MTAARASTLPIETPEGVIFSYELATPVTRSLACAVDAIAASGLAYIASKVCAVAGILSQDWANFLGLVLYFVISIGYSILLEWRWRGQTVGKRLFGLRVIDIHGLRLQPAQIVLRNLLRLVDSLPAFYLVGGIAALVSRHGQRLGDLAANTVVAHERHWNAPDLEQIAPARYNSLLAYPHLAGRLRALASPEAVGFAVRALARRDGYDPLARIELFAELAGYFRSLVTFPQAATEGLTDEQYVRSVLRVIFGPDSRSGR